MKIEENRIKKLQEELKSLVKQKTNISNSIIWTIFLIIIIVIPSIITSLIILNLSVNTYLIGKMLIWACTILTESFFVSILTIEMIGRVNDKKR